MAGGVGVGSLVTGDAEQRVGVAALGPAKPGEVFVGVHAGGGHVRVVGEVECRVKEGVDCGHAGAGWEQIDTKCGGRGCRECQGIVADGEGVTDEGGGLSGEVDDIAGL